MTPKTTNSATNRTSDGFLKNGTKVSFMFRKWNKETRNFETVGRVEGVIRDGDYNVCTFERGYDIDFTNPLDGRTWTTIGVTESRLTILE